MHTSFIKSRLLFLLCSHRVWILRFPVQDTAVSGLRHCSVPPWKRQYLALGTAVSHLGNCRFLPGYCRFCGGNNLSDYRRWLICYVCYVRYEQRFLCLYRCCRYGYLPPICHQYLQRCNRKIIKQFFRYCCRWQMFFHFQLLCRGYRCLEEKKLLTYSAKEFYLKYISLQERREHH